MNNRTATKLLKSFAIAIFAAGLLAGPASAAEGTVNGDIAFSNGLTTDAKGQNARYLSPGDRVDFGTVFEYSPDGSKLAAVSYLKGKEAIYVSNADGSSRKRVSPPGESVEAAHWTADGSRLIYLSDRDETTGTEVYSVAADGTGEAMLAADGTDLSQGRDDDSDHSEVPSFSVVGEHIAYPTAAGEGDSDIVVMDLDGGNRLELTSDALNDVQPVIAPDGTSLVFTKLLGDGKAQVMRIGIDGSGLTALTPADRFSTNPFFTPDGSKIAYNLDSAVMIMNADGSGSKELVDSSTSGFVSGVTPDGSRVIYDFVNYGREAYFTVRSFTIGIESGGKKRLSGLIGDWQALDAPSARPEIVIAAKAAKLKPKHVPAVIVDCSNECDLEITTTGKLGGERVKLKVKKVSQYGGYGYRIPLMSQGTFRKFSGAKGTLKVAISGVDTYEQTDKVTTKVKVG